MTENLVNGLSPFHAMEILAEAKKLEAAGHDICHLEVGEPAAPPAPGVIEAVSAILPEPQRYTHAKGQTELREALSAYYAERHSADVNPENIIVTMGSSSGFILSFLTAFRPGARIAVTRPGYPAYLNILAGMGYVPVEIVLEADNAWRLTPEAVTAAHEQSPFDGLLFASPANPTGAAVSREALQAIAATCERLGVTFISDEIYHGLDYTAPSSSALEFTNNAMIVNSFSKYYCMTGWRIGWMVVPDSMIRRAEMLQQNLFISAPTLSQVAARVALGERDYAEAQKAHYAANREQLVSGLAELGFGISAPPDGAFYAYADVSRFTNDSMRFCRELLAAAGVAATPGIDFDRANGSRFVRFSYAGDTSTMHKSLERIASFLRRR